MGGVIMNERICTPPLEGLRRGDAHTNENTQHNTLAQVPNRIPASCNPTSHHKTSPSPSPSPPSQLRPVAVRVVHKLQHHPLGVARRTAPKAHTRGAVRRARAHPEQVVAQRRAVQPVVPRPRRRGHRRAPPVARRMQRPLVVQVQPLERRADLALRPTPLPPVPAPPSLRSTSAPPPASRACKKAQQK